MKKLLVSVMAVFSTVLLIGCGKDGGGGNTTTVVVPTNTCPIGQVLSGNICINPPNGIAPNTTVNFYDYNRYFDSWGNYSSNGDLTITNTRLYQLFLEEALGVCNTVIWGLEAGLSKCENWVSGSFRVEFSVTPALTPTVRFTAQPAPSFFQYFINFGVNFGGFKYNPLILTQKNTFGPFAADKGFVIRAPGAWGTKSGLKTIEIQVDQGSLNDGYFNYRLYYMDNVKSDLFATGKFKRY